MKTIDWDALFTKLESWNKARVAASGAALAVNQAADYYEELGAERPWAVLVSTIISLRTKDEVTVVASPRLIKIANTPQKMLALSLEEIEKAIYPAGFYHTKAANLKKIAQVLTTKYNGKVPDTEEELLALPGVGRKTAALVLDEGYHKAAICVDTHVHRISNRMGWVATKNPDKTQEALMQILPKKYWRRINLILVRYGRDVCTPISPWCSKCIITEFCGQVNVGKKR
jgi:endonuclease-3